MCGLPGLVARVSLRSRDRKARSERRPRRRISTQRSRRSRRIFLENSLRALRAPRFISSLRSRLRVLRRLCALRSADCGTTGSRAARANRPAPRASTWWSRCAASSVRTGTLCCNLKQSL